MRPKNIDCVKALVDIALEDGNFLAESWGSVLRYISQLARLQVGGPNMTSTCCVHYRSCANLRCAFGVGSPAVHTTRSCKLSLIRSEPQVKAKRAGLLKKYFDLDYPTYRRRGRGPRVISAASFFVVPLIL